MNRKVFAEQSRSTIAEMDSSSLDSLIPLNQDMVAKVTEGDPDPMFVTLEVLNEGVSANGRYYDADALAEVCSQINANRPDGYAGHLQQSERSSKVPDVETIWLGAVVKEVDGKLRLFAKGYVLPDATKRRSYIKRAKAAGKRISVSIYGTARQVYDSAIKAYRQAAIELESIDWARWGAEGVRTSGSFAVTAEMHDESNSKGESMEKAEVLKAATLEDLKQYVSPEVISEMTSEAVNAAKAESREVVSEMADITAQLGDKPLETIAEMRKENAELKLDKELSSKVSDSVARKMVRRMVVSEMREDSTLTVDQAVDRVLASEEGKHVVAEMTAVEPVVQPKIAQPAAKADKHRFITKRG